VWLAGTLWPESPEELALSNLRRTLTDLRRALGEEASRLRSPSLHTLALDLSGAQADVVAFDEAVAQGDLASLKVAVALYQGPLLDGWEEEWLFQERQVREQAVLEALERLAEHARHQRDSIVEERYLRRAAALDPLRESVQRALMQCLAAGGNTAAAHSVYRELRERLHRELNVEPDPETTRLFQQLREEARGKTAPRSWLRAPSEGRRPTSVNELPPSQLGARSQERGASIEATRNNLPAQPTPLLGREQEIAQLRELLRCDDVRLVTLSGPGGSGKTRLGLHVAADLFDDYADGVFFINLSPITDSNLVVATIAQVLGVRESEGRSLQERLAEYLRERELLLLLDNFEQVLDAAPRVAELLAAAPRMKVLVTSRAVLRLRGEKAFLVPPLALPERGRLPDLAALSQYAAVELFIQRARDCWPEFAVTNENAPALAEVCHRLEGLPLAIELAAARVRVLDLESLLARLEHRLRFLTGGARDLPRRQRTLRNTIAWSYDLLTEAEQLLFRRLSVFAGGCTLAAAEAVCAAEDLAIDFLDGLDSLAAKSLLRPEEPVEGERRFGMLETIREYALEALEGSGEASTVRGRHRTFFLALAEEAGLERLEVEHDNLRSALDWMEADGQWEAGLRLASALSWPLWETRGYWTEGRERLARLLALSGAESPTVARASGLRAWGHLAEMQGDWDSAKASYQESLAICRELGDRKGIDESIRFLGAVAWLEREFADAWALLEESLAFRREQGDRHGVADVLEYMGLVAEQQGDYPRARALYEESLSILRALGGQQGIAALLTDLGRLMGSLGEAAAAKARLEESLAICRGLGDQPGIAAALFELARLPGLLGGREAARALLEESLAICREWGYASGVAWRLQYLGLVAEQQGDDESARSLYEESLATFWEKRDMPGILRDLEGLAAVAVAQGQFQRGSRIFGAAEALRDVIGRGTIWSQLRVGYEHSLSVARAALGETAFAAEWAAGRTMPLEKAVAFALAAEA
jgi:predicted ATPase/DNA-binding SARP family transcriptional activator